jgi:hypothetical protein
MKACCSEAFSRTFRFNEQLNRMSGMFVSALIKNNSARWRLTQRHRLQPESIFSIVANMTIRPQLQDKEIGELWRRYKPLEGNDATADLVMGLLRKLVYSRG